jgi:hypothetical protein
MGRLFRKFCGGGDFHIANPTLGPKNFPPAAYIRKNRQT